MLRATIFAAFVCRFCTIAFAASDPPPPPPDVSGIEAGDTVAVDSSTPLHDEDRTLLTLNTGERVVVDGLLGDWALVSTERDAQRTRGWVRLNHLTHVKRRDARAEPFTDAEGNVYYCVRLDAIKIDAKDCPGTSTPPPKTFPSALYPRAILDGVGEAYVAFASPEWKLADVGWLAVRAPRGQAVAGWLQVPRPDGSRSFRARFQLDLRATDPVGDGMFLWAKRAHYLALARGGLPGGPWFRHQAGQVPGRPTDQPAAPRQSTSDPQLALTRAFDVFCGGRAIAENLQLERHLAESNARGKQVGIRTLQGISIPEFDWRPLLEDKNPAIDRLSTRVPHDQHVVFFPSLKAAVALYTEGTVLDTPLLHFAEPRSENAHLLERYERQLGLRISRLEQTVGAHRVGSLVLTGSDPHFPSGTDLALLFESSEPEALEQEIWSIVLQAGDKYPKAAQQSGEIAGLAWRAIVSPDRRISSYLARWDNVVLVANSRCQIERWADLREGRCPPIAELPEYRFFRSRYALGAAEETALVFISDATIRRWCSPRWRIADARRIRAAATMADLQAANFEAIVTRTVKRTELEPRQQSLDLGTVTLSRRGVSSSIYGSLGFLTPIAELDLQEVSQSEADAYDGWRTAFEREWRFAFDPIALRAEVTADRISADVTVMPLIANTSYRELNTLAQGVEIQPQAGDRHPTHLHGIVAVNWAAAGLGPELRQCLGSTVELYVDPDPFWTELAALAARLDLDENEHANVLEESLSRMPVAVRLAVTDRAKASLLFDLGRAAGGELRYREQVYLGVGTKPSGPAGRPIHVWLADDSLVLTFSESLLKRAIDRWLARGTDAKPTECAEAGRPWLGRHLSLRVDKELLEVANAFARGQYRRAMQHTAWANLPILNEWKRRFPTEDPVAVHRRVWDVELVCPGGGRYVWNDAWKSMESTVYGHPGEPKDGPPAPAVLSTFDTGSFGLEFEPNGIRGRVRLERGAGGTAGASPQP